MSPAGLTTTEPPGNPLRSEEHTSELQSQSNLVCRLLLEKKKNNADDNIEDYTPNLNIQSHTVPHREAYNSEAARVSPELAQYAQDYSAPVTPYSLSSPAA